MVMFGFEPDTLEVLLREEMDVVDYIFIVEAQRTHQKEVAKPLMWEALKHSERFASFVDPAKVVHIVVDEAASAEAQKNQKTFKMEKLQTRLGVERIREWAKNTQGLGPDDVFSGDADEVNGADDSAPDPGGVLAIYEVWPRDPMFVPVGSLRTEKSITSVALSKGSRYMSVSVGDGTVRVYEIPARPADDDGWTSVTRSGRRFGAS